MKEVKDKGEHIRGSDLKISESDIFSSLPFFKRVVAWTFGGVYGMRDPQTKSPKTVVVYLPPVWKRIYFKHFYKQGSKNE